MKKTYIVRTIILAGSLLMQLSTICFHAYGAAGDVDLSFVPDLGVNARVNAVAVQPDGKVLIGGTRITIGGSLVNLAIVRLNADGGVDATFTVDPNGGFNDVSSIAFQSNGKVLVGHDKSFIRLDSNGDPDPGFIEPSLLGDGVFVGVGSIAIQSDGKVLIGGLFNYVNGELRNGIARLNANGTLDTSFNPGFGVNGPLYPAVGSIAVQPDGKMLIGGNFVYVNDTNRNGIARLNADGSLDTSFDPGTGVLEVASLALQPDGRVLIGGSFNNVNGTNLIGIARLNTDGSVDNSFNPGTGAFGVASVVLQSDGKLLIGGSFDTVNGTNRNGIARLNANGSLDSSFDPGSRPNPYIIAIAVQADGKVIIGGADIYGNVPDHKVLTRLYGDSFAPPLSIAQSNAFVIVSWPVTGLNFQLQENTDLALPNSWSPVAQPAATNGNQVSVNIPTMIGSKFFRLKSQ